jgi:hypothetical protein
MWDRGSRFLDVRLDVIMDRVLDTSDTRRTSGSSRVCGSDDCRRDSGANLTPKGARRDLTAMREAGERGRKVMTAQRYEVLNAVVNGDHVALEVQWTGL